MNGLPTLPVFPFIIGSGRSGTTLLRAMFNAHRETAVMNESQFIADMGRHRGDYEHVDGVPVDSFVTDLFKNAKFRRVGMDEDRVRSELRASPPTSYPDAVRRVFMLFAEGKGKSRYGDKTPGYILEIPLLARLFPEGRFIHIIRDGRDCALSYAERPFGPKTPVEAAIYWKRRVVRGRKAGRQLGADRYREVFYEDLIARPEHSLEDLSRFVALDFDRAMLRYFERPEESVLGTGDPKSHQRLLLPPTQGLRNWREEMPAEDGLLFEALAGDLLGELGYERVFERPSALDQVRARSRWLGAEAQRTVSSARSLARSRSGRGTRRRDQGRMR